MQRFGLGEYCTSRQYGDKSIHLFLPYETVVGSLDKTYDTSYRESLIAVAGCLAAPRRAIDHDTLFFNADYRVVVVQQFATGK